MLLVCGHCMLQIGYSIKTQTSGTPLLLVPSELDFILFILYLKNHQQIEKYDRQAFMIMYNVDTFSLPFLSWKLKSLLEPSPTLYYFNQNDPRPVNTTQSVVH